MPERYVWPGVTFEAVWNNSTIYSTNATTTSTGTYQPFTITTEVIEDNIEPIESEAIRPLEMTMDRLIREYPPSPLRDRQTSQQQRGPRSIYGFCDIEPEDL